MITPTEDEKHKNPSVCYVCNKEFTTYDKDKNYCKVRHHCLLVSTKVPVIEFVGLN